MKTFHLTVSTPDGNAFCGDCTAIFVRGTEGELCIMADHAPFVTSVVKGECKIAVSEDEERTATLDGGIITTGENRVTLIAGSFKFTE